MKKIAIMRIGLGGSLATQLALLVAWYLSGWTHELVLIVLGAWVANWYQATSPFWLPFLRWIRRRL